VVVVYLGFRKALRRVSHHIVAPKLMNTDQLSGQWIEMKAWMNCWV